MRISKHEQRSPEWYAERLGVPSASQFHRIITPTGQASKQVDGYINELVAEKVTQQQAYVHETEAMKRGTELEPLARENFEFITDYAVSEIGFCKHDKLAPRCGSGVSTPPAAPATRRPGGPAPPRAHCQCPPPAPAVLPLAGAAPRTAPGWPARRPAS